MIIGETEILIFIAGAALGGLIAYFLARIRHAAAEHQLDLECAALAERLRAQEEQKEFVEEARSALSDNFRALSTSALQQNNQLFLDLAKSSLEKFQQGAKNDLEQRQKSIEQLVKPLGESLTKVNSKIEEIEKVRQTAYGSITEQLKSISATEAQLRLETGNLVKALRTPHVRGAWGELHLRRTVELAGMTEHCDFEEQESSSTDERRYRPDLIVKLPGNRQIIVDAKAPLMAYLESLEAPDEVTRAIKLREHGQQVRKHIQNLNSKAYWEQFEGTPELVVMFLPGEPFLSAAVEHDSRLIEFGAEQKVLIATPLTLIALLRAVAYGWRQERLTENAQKISVLGKELYDRVRTFTERLVDLRSGLEKAVNSFNQAVGSFHARVLPSARKFKDLSVDSGKEIPALEVIETPTRAAELDELMLSAESKLEPAVIAATTTSTIIDS